MRNIYSYLSIAVFSILIFACSEKEIGDPFAETIGGGAVLYATIENPIEEETTKAYIREDLKVVWDASDAVSVFRFGTTNQKYTYSGEAGTNTGSFSRDGSGSTSGTSLNYVYAVYPYDASNNKMTREGEISVTTSPTQSYRVGSFGKGANLMVSVTGNDNLNFKNVCGFLKIRLYGDNVKISRLRLEGNNGEHISGEATISASASGTPTVSFSSSSYSYVDLDCGSGVSIGSSAGEATEFWLVLPPVTFTKGFKLTVYEQGTGKTFVQTASNSFTIKSNLVKKMAALKVVPTQSVSGVELNKATLSLAKGSSETLVATVKPADASNKNVTWSSSDDSVASVDASGKVTAKSAGKATITARTEDGGKTATCSVSVTVPVTGVTLNKSRINLTKGGSETLTATVKPTDATNKTVTWTSSNTSVAAVSSSGKVTAKAAGEATITVKTADGSKVATCVVSVFEFVDLGLSVKWATTNVGATSPSGYGDYFAWGEIAPKTGGYDWSTYKWCNGSETTLKKYNTHSSFGSVDNKKILDAADDAAHANCGGSWRMPTNEDWNNLIDNCTWTWTTVNGVKGYRITSKKSGYTSNSIFLPAAGWRDGTKLNGVGENGWYWSSTLYTKTSTGDPMPYMAMHLFIGSSSASAKGGARRCYGYAIRPVSD